jgi:hypothetical protein
VKGDPDTPCQRTQRRWLERAAHVLALCQQLSLEVAARVVGALGLMGLDHQRARSQFGATRRMRERGRAVSGLLEPLTLDAQLWPRLLAAGTLGQAWGEARIWSVSTGRLHTAQAVLARAGRAPPWITTKVVLLLARPRP